uniref:Glutaredoxin domain-containing protein n=2 Tax=Cannabis sativa TaxID=3483 RepID=A0A803RB68_CANSA
MSDSGKILQIPENPPSFFNRSLTMSSSSSTTVQQNNNNKPNNNNSFNRTSSFKKLITSVVEPKVKKLKNIFLEAIKTTSSSYSNEEAEKSIGPRLAGTEDRIVVYLTSLRGVRRTYEDCYAVRMIFGGFRVWVDERDVSMDSAYRKELQTLLKRKPSLPQVFIRGNYVGGADVIKQLFETGQLAQTLKDFRVREAVGFVCESCADMRFVPCWNCSGSRKVFDEDQGSLSRCLECNENGLIRCPRCSSSSVNV